MVFVHPYHVFEGGFDLVAVVVIWLCVVIAGVSMLQTSCLRSQLHSCGHASGVDGHVLEGRCQGGDCIPSRCNSDIAGFSVGGCVACLVDAGLVSLLWLPAVAQCVLCLLLL